MYIFNKFIWILQDKKTCILSPGHLNRTLLCASEQRSACWK